MIIEGNIDNQDYANCFKFTQLPPSLRLKLFQYSVYAFIFLFSYLFVVLPQGGNKYFIGFIFTYIIIALVFLFGRVSMKIYVSDFKRLAESNNAGKATYEIVGNSIEFKGSMYECKIPISSIVDILNNNGTYYLKFGNSSGFIVPRTLSSGFMDEFVGAIKSHQKGINAMSN